MILRSAPVPLVALAVALALAASCASPPPRADAPEAPEAGAPPVGSAGDGGQATPPVPWTFETLARRPARSLERAVEVELVRARRPDGGASYLLYVPPPAPREGGAPVVVAHEPYAGIDWTGEDVDARWAAQGNGARPDVDAPAYDGDDLTAYGAQSVQQAVDADAVFRLNGFAVVHTYARYYAGSDVAGDVLDAAAGWHFVAARRAALDVTRAGAFGGSWGGMMTLFGARQAPPEVAPRALAAMTPLSDFVDEARWTDVDLPARYPRPAEASAFFSPYWRRAEPSMGRPPVPGPRSAPYTHAGLCPGLTAKVFAPHDDWDLLVPVRQTEGLAAACGANVEPLYWRRGPIDWARTPLDHGLLGAEPTLPSVATFAWTFLVHALAPPATTTLVTAGHEAALVVFLGTVRDAQRAGRDPGAVLPRLRELADPRTSFFEVDGGALGPGADVLARAVNAVWGTRLDAASLRTQLATGLPAPPPP